MLPMLAVCSCYCIVMIMKWSKDSGVHTRIPVILVAPVAEGVQHPSTLAWSRV